MARFFSFLGRRSSFIGRLARGAGSTHRGFFRSLIEGDAFVKKPEPKKVKNEDPDSPGREVCRG